MSKDSIEMLRDLVRMQPVADNSLLVSTIGKAADEIESLRAEVEQLKQNLKAVSDGENHFHIAYDRVWATKTELEAEVERLQRYRYEEMDTLNAEIARLKSELARLW